MQIVIDIPEEQYNTIKSDLYNTFPAEMKEWGLEAIRNGTPLSKGHGKLGDLDLIKKEMQKYHNDCAKTSEYTRLGFETAMAVVEDAKPIIEADTESEEV